MTIDIDRKGKNNFWNLSVKAIRFCFFVIAFAFAFAQQILRSGGGRTVRGKVSFVASWEKGERFLSHVWILKGLNQTENLKMACLGLFASLEMLLTSFFCLYSPQ